VTLPLSEIQPDGSQLTDEAAYGIIRTLVDSLDREKDEMDEARDYYDGDQDIKYATEEFQKAFGDLFGDLKANWCDVAISATEERLEMDRIVFRSEEGAEMDEESTAAVQKVLRANDIDTLENELYSSAMVEKRSAVIVWPGEEDDDQDVLVTPNRGQVVKVVYEDDNPQRPMLAIKKWRTEVGEVFLTLYTPDFVYKYKVPKNFADLSDDITNQSTYELSGWQRRKPNETGDSEWPLPNPFSRIPIVEFHARKNRSELKSLLPIQDAVNKVLINMLVAADYASHSQTFIISTAAAPDGGWKRRPGEIWQVPPEVDLDGKALPTAVGSLPSEDPSNFISIIEHLLAEFSNLSATPGYYIFNSNSQSGRGDAPSGDSLKISETTLIKKIEKYQQRYDLPWVRVGLLILEALNIDAPDYGEVSWANAQKHFMGMLLEEGRKMLDELQLPPESAWRHIGMSEAEIIDARKWLDEQIALEQEKIEQEQKAAMSKDTNVTKNTADQMSNGSTSKNT